MNDFVLFKLIVVRIRHGVRGNPCLSRYRGRFKGRSSSFHLGIVLLWDVCQYTKNLSSGVNTAAFLLVIIPRELFIYVQGI